MKESEITADLTQQSFESYIQKFTNELGKPEIHRRVSFIVLQQGKPLDNRIKITDGKARIVQKLRTPANKLGHRVNEEVEIDIPDNLESVKNSINLFINFYQVYDIETLSLVVQHENYIWANPEFELKIAKQFGKQDLYLYEIETFSDKSPEEIQNKLGIKADFNSFSPEREALRRGEVDIPFGELSEKELDDIILKYLRYTD